MVLHVCPDEICGEFDGDATAKAKARAKALAWLMKQDVRKGDLVYMPDPASGALIEMNAEANIKDRIN